MRFTSIAAVAFALVGTPLAARPAVHPLANVAAAVADTADRTPDNVKLDAGRKPVEVLRFMGLRRGMQVLDPFGGNKYWAEITAPAVGPSGHVTIWQPTQFMNDKRKAELDEFTARQKNVGLISSPFEAPNLPKNAFDFTLINLDYHDVYWESAERKIPRMDPQAWLKSLYAAMKPGATVGVIDHIANPGNTRAAADKLHRIDPNVVRADFRRAGFILIGTSNLLRNRADDHSLLVFDPKIRGNTDRFVFKFKKPR